MNKKLNPETIEKLEWLKVRLRKYPHRYDQRNFCGTQACLAGFCIPRVVGAGTVTITESREFAVREKLGDSLGNVAGRWLDITACQKTLLFAPEWDGKAAKFNRLDTDTDVEASKKARQRIDLFIQSGGTK